MLTALTDTKGSVQPMHPTRKRRRSQAAHERLHSEVSTNQPLRPTPLPRRAVTTNTSLLNALEDRRRFHPLGREAPPATITRRAARRHVSAGQFYQTLRFATPQGVVRCIRRKIRRQVMHALKYTGKGSRTKIRHYNEDSWIHCK